MQPMRAPEPASPEEGAKDQAGTGSAGWDAGSTPRLSPQTRLLLGLTYAVGVLVAVVVTLWTMLLFMASDSCTGPNPYESCERWINLTVLGLLPLPTLLALVGGIVALRARSSRAKLIATFTVLIGAALLLPINIAVISAVSDAVSQ